MKKLLVILALFGFIVSCGGGADSKTEDTEAVMEEAGEAAEAAMEEMEAEMDSTMEEMDAVDSVAVEAAEEMKEEVE
ncbi:MAG: hypothetical protein AAF789_01630 [Bacteroidota bacterium]